MAAAHIDAPRVKPLSLYTGCVKPGRPSPQRLIWRFFGARQRTQLVKLDHPIFKLVANAVFGTFISRSTDPKFFNVQFSSACLARQRIAA